MPSTPEALVSPPLEPMGVRMRRQRRRLGLTLGELAARAGMSKPYLSLIETGRVPNPPSDEKLSRLEQVLQLPVGELVSQAQLQRTPSAVRAVLAELLRTSGSTSPDAPTSADGDPLAGALRHLIGRAGNDVELLAAPAVPVLRPMFRPVFRPVSVGGGGTDPGRASGVAPESVDGFVGCPGLTDPAAFAASVGGDAMSPRFNDGDIVIFSPAVPVRSGDDCFVRLADGRTTFRRVFPEPADDHGADRVRLQPRNERYRPLTVPATLVAGVCRALFRYERLAGEPH